MITAAVAGKLEENDDLDWKQALPSFARTPGVWNEFAKDIAAMANTRGGLLIYGVSDQIELVGVDLKVVNEQQMLNTVRTGIQPYVSGVDIIPLSDPDGAGPDLLVVDVAPSDTAPHFQYGWEQRDKDRATFNAPYRIGSETFYMPEHQIARAYQERFTRQAAAATALRTLVDQATETAQGEFDGGRAWLVIAARPTRPLPRLVPAPTQAEAKYALSEGVDTASRLTDAFTSGAVLSQMLANDMRVGLRRWVDSNFLVPELRTNGHGAMVELHYDGAVVVCVDLTGTLESDGIPVDTQVLSTVVMEAVAVTDVYRRQRAVDGPVEITAAIASSMDDKRPSLRPVLQPYRPGLGSVRPVERARQPRRVLPSATELSPTADDAALRAAVAELVSGLLHQFGINQL
ncbi:AlbA family DNA-binding domain-containing protein [Streptomyces pini]|uniref:Putative DNA-binding domain-containing protein n=1 Tax=Streptomyces pini TaxID=1520580 RepID=A0A1I4JSE6_9ACTN|nr:ATP-binding protein [Streptomyces pini]SFL69241.1 Putative DNA-binding domain-containing protein [Streptomyces pini]